MSHIFFSYSHEDAETAQKVISMLESKGYTVWQDISQIKGGDLWEKRLMEGIVESAVFVVLWSKNSMTRDWVKWEIEQATALNKPRIPVCVENVKTNPLNYGLGDNQAISLERGIDADAFLKALGPFDEHIRRRRVGFEFGTQLGQQAPTKQMSLPDGKDLVFVPLIVSSYCKAYVVGTAETVIRAPQTLQLCLQFSGPENAAFVFDVYQHLHQQQNAKPSTFSGLLVTGPASDGRYTLNPTNQAQWTDAAETTFEALKVFHEPKKPHLQIFGNLPVALGMGIVAPLYKEWWSLDIYHFTPPAKYDPIFYLVRKP